MKTTPRDFFLNLGIMVALVWVATSTIVVLFDIINALFPDAYTMSRYYGSAVTVSTFALSSIIILFPILVVATRILQRDIAAEPTRAHYAIRRWMMYLTMFIAGLTVITDLIIIVNTLLSGGTTLRFFLQALSILVVAGGVFWYVKQQLNRDYTQPSHDKILLGVVSTFLLLLVVVSVIISGTPQQQRSVNADLQRLNTLIVFENTVLNYFSSNGMLPENADVFTDALGNPQIPVDPITQEPLEYEKTAALTFKICATFDGSFDDIPEEWDVYGLSRSTMEKRWNFDEGRTCFDRAIDPTKVQPGAKPIVPEFAL